MISSVQIQNDVTVIALTGSLDVSLQKQFKQELQDLVSASGGDVVLDFASVTFIDSSCLGALVTLTKEVREKRGDIKIARAADEVLSIFQITRLDRLFTIFDSLPEAIDDFFST